MGLPLQPSTLPLDAFRWPLGEGSAGIHQPAAFRLGYVPYLDGLRALAIWLVMGYHGLDPLSNRLALVLNGWMGVDVFFVISGFLITSLLIQEKEEHGTISFKGFYIRRSLRIIPAYVVFLVVMLFIYGRGVLNAVLVSGAYLSDYDLALGLGTVYGAGRSVARSSVIPGR